MNNSKKFKKGGVSIFIVTITCILITIVTASFVRLMIRDQDQASKNDLSQSAYDSAQAGVEDAKRFLSIYQKNCANGKDLTKKAVDGKQIDCQGMKNAIDAQGCYTLAAAGIGENGKETVIQTSSSSNDGDLNQAYTCVKIATKSADFLGQASEGASSTVQLKGESAFNQVTVRWHSRSDLSGASGSSSNLNLDNISNPNSRPTIDSKNWRSNNKPAILKAQFYGYTNGSSNVLAGLDTIYKDDKTGADELLFYPSRGVRTVNTASLPETRRTTTTSVSDYTFTRCINTFTSTDSYVCEMTINIGNSVSPSDTFFLRLTPLMNSASFKVELKNNGNIVNFDGVQPKVDSTGRANTQYRRVESRVEYGSSNFPVPSFAAETESDSVPLCKDFWVTKQNSGQSKTDKAISCPDLSK